MYKIRLITVKKGAKKMGVSKTKTIIFAGFFSCVSFAASAQEQDGGSTIDKKVEQLETEVDNLSSNVKKLSKFKFSGYIQTDLQYGDKEASFKVGAGRFSEENTAVRFGVRRGRLKLTYSDNLKGVASNAVLQVDITERGVNVKDVYFSFTDPWVKWFSIQTGIFDRPFGNEISYSSSLRESPERSTGCQELFPGERDLGVMLVIAAPKNHLLEGLKLETGLFSGNGIASASAGSNGTLDFKNKKDWISHLSYKKYFDIVQLGIGTSFYYGGVIHGSDTVYQMQDKQFVLVEDAKKGGYSQRMYWGVDAQLLISTKLGITNLRAEYIVGNQPGTASSFRSPNSNSVATASIYRRDISSFYVILVQDFGNRHSLVLKYDQWNPNTKISGNENKAPDNTRTGIRDIALSNFGVGYLFRLNANIRLMAYYDMGMNETSENLKSDGYDRKRMRDIIIIRAQYKF